VFVYWYLDLVCFTLYGPAFHGWCLLGHPLTLVALQGLSNSLCTRK
jgi:hypothetical protein